MTAFKIKIHVSGIHYLEQKSALLTALLGLGGYRCGARYPILSAPDDADTDTGSDFIALYAD
jgi:hypothetical protein